MLNLGAPADQKGQLLHSAVSARGGDNNALVIAEITRECERIINGGRRVSIKGFKNGQA
jgi:hypothetical protein